MEPMVRVSNLYLAVDLAFEGFLGRFVTTSGRIGCRSRVPDGRGGISGRGHWDWSHVSWTSLICGTEIVGER